MIECNAAAAIMNFSVDHSNMHLDNSQHGPQLRVHGIHHDFVPANKLITQPNSLQRQHTHPSATGKSYEYHVAKGVSSPPELDVEDSKLLGYQGTALDSLINTLMQQCHPTVGFEEGKTTRNPCLDDVLVDVRSGGDLAKHKISTPKWDKDGKWVHTKLSSTHATSKSTTHTVPLFKLSHNEQTPPAMSAEQGGFASQPSYNKVHFNPFEFQACRLQVDAYNYDKDILKNEIEKLTDAVTCAQACLERIRPIPPPRNTNSNPFLAQGVFRNRVDPKMTQSTSKHSAQIDPGLTKNTFKHGAQIDPATTKSVLGSPHVPTSSTDVFWTSPIKADKYHAASSNSYHLAASQAEQKELFMPSGAHSGSIKPLLKDFENRGDNTKVADCFQIQKLDKSGQGRTAVTSLMKDACTEITPTSSHRDMGTQMTPVGSSRQLSRPHSPDKGSALSPARRIPPTRILPPVVKGIIDMSRMNPLEVERCHRAKLEWQELSVQDQVQQSLGKSFDSYWSSREEEEEDIGKGLRHLDLEDLKQDVMEARASVWKEATRLKLLAKYEKEETKIQAWEELQAAKAEADLKKLEMKLEKKRLQTTAKIASKLGAAQKRAGERRAAAKAYRVEALERTSSHVDDMCDEANALRASYPWCACFSTPLS